jgi:carbonic anhydrase
MTTVENPPPTADDALQRLASGNRRYAAGQLSHPRQTPPTRLELAKAQHPFAVILGCCDSRVPPELIFDQGLGDLYVVRVAAHLADSLVLGSLELAVQALAIRLIVVLGHDQCAAVAATVQSLGYGAPGSAPATWAWQQGWRPVASVPTGHLGHLVAALKPAVDDAYSRSGSLLDHAIDANIRRVVELLKASGPTLVRHVQEHGLRIVGARYNLATGEVTFMP